MQIARKIALIMQYRRRAGGTRYIQTYRLAKLQRLRANACGTNSSLRAIKQTKLNTITCITKNAASPIGAACEKL